MNIIHSDCLEEMRKMEANSISAIVTDPPYGLSFMGKGWDHGVPGINYWKACIRVIKPGGFLLAMGGSRTSHKLTSAIEEAGFEIRDCLMWIYGSGFPKSHNHFGLEGYGTALKPAYEPIIMAMKPLDGTFRQNAEKWGQAGINIDGCRVESNGDHFRSEVKGRGESFLNERQGMYTEGRGFVPTNSAKGRWPANVICDEEAGRLLDEQSGLEASRFFYCAKPSSSERGESNNHPTVKPLKLMEYLIKLVMPPKDGILLDPFAGSGTTILAAKNLGFKAIGIEKQKEYCDIAKSRIYSEYELF